jgi:flagellin
MSLSILTNVTAMSTRRNLQASAMEVSTAMQRLSSGLRINSAADDAAGYAISQGLTSQVNGLDQAGRNVSDATSMTQTAEGALNNIQSMLQRVSELAVQYQNGDLSASNKSDIQSEVDQLTLEINRQSTSVQFNNINLLDGTAGGSGGPGVTFQVGPGASDTLTVSFANVEGSTGLGTTGFSWSSISSGALTSGSHVLNLASLGSTAISTISAAIDNISNLAANLGAVQNRLAYTANAISVTEQNMSASLSSIQDVDMASTMTKLTQQQVLQQAGTAMLAQANSQPQLVLKLITG